MIGDLTHLVRYPRVDDLSQGYGSAAEALRDTLTETQGSQEAAMVWTTPGYQVRALSLELNGDGALIHLVTVHEDSFSTMPDAKNPPATPENCTHVFMVRSIEQAKVIGHHIVTTRPLDLMPGAGP